MSRPLLLIVDDDKTFVCKLADALDGLFDIEACYSETEFRQRFAIGKYDLLMMDMRLEKNKEGLELLKEVLAQDPMQAAIVMTAYADMETYTDAIQSGALNYLDKREFSPALIARTVEAILQQGQLRKRLAAVENRLEISDPLEIIGLSATIKQVGELLRRVAEDGNIPVLVTGEPGSGKELVARNIHRLNSRRAEGPFICVPCGRLPRGAAQSTLFGSTQGLERRGSRESRGRTDDAKGGILFVNGITGLDDFARSALLNFIESGSFMRVGRNRRIEVDTQVIIAASDTEGRTAAFGEIHKTIIERCSGVEIHVPALRERVEDIPLISQYMLQNLYRQGRTQARSFRSAAITVLESLSWPGNVRELKSAVEYAAIQADAAGIREIGPEHLPQSASETPVRLNSAPAAMDYHLHLARAELLLVEIAIERFETTKIEDLAGKLRYNNRFTFSRRIRSKLEAYPLLGSEFPNTARLFKTDKRKR
jgi:DNA-binding NtrC family response regulator